MKYSRQFVILKKDAHLEGFRQEALWDGWLLQFHPDLPVFMDREKKLLLLGIAWQAMPGKPSPEQEMKAIEPGPDGEIPLDTLFRMEETWCGRYVLIAGDRVLMDATGKMAVYYAREGISGNLSLLAKVCGLKENPYKPQSVTLNWMPGPRTPYAEIRQCMPSQIFRLAAGQVESRACLSPLPEEGMDREALLHEIVRCFDASLRNMEKALEGWKLLAALTGGYDSRALLALLHHAGVSFDAFTLEHAHISKADTSLPPLLSQRAGVGYQWVPRSPADYSKELENEYVAFTSGLIQDEDRVFYGFGQYQALLKKYGKCVFLRSAIWGTLAERYAAAFDSQGPNSVFYQWFGIADHSPEKESLEEYLEWMRAHPQPGLSPADAFFWDQREGSWMGPIENGFDLMEGCMSLHPANCRYILSLLSRFPREERITKAYEAAIAACAFPEIGDVPYTVQEKKNKLARILKKLRKGWDRLTKFGLKNTVKTYMSIFSHRSDVKKNRKDGK